MNIFKLPLQENHEQGIYFRQNAFSSPSYSNFYKCHISFNYDVIYGHKHLEKHGFIFFIYEQNILIKHTSFKMSRSSPNILITGDF